MTPILLDTTVGIVIVLSIIVAFFRGFVKEVLMIVNIIAASAAAWYLGKDLVPSFQSWLGAPGADGEEPGKIMGMIPPDVMATFLAYASVFFGAFLILALAGMAISSSIQAMGLGPVDKALGMFFGAARGFLLVFLIYMPCRYFAPPTEKDYPSWMTESMSFVALENTYVWLDKYIGKDEDGDGKEADEELGPIGTRLKKMGDDLTNEQNTREQQKIDEQNRKMQTPHSDQQMRELPQEILTDEELRAP